MKNLDLDAYGVSEMSSAEMREVEGGYSGFAHLVQQAANWIKENCSISFDAFIGFPPSAGFSISCPCN